MSIERPWEDYAPAAPEVKPWEQDYGLSQGTAVQSAGPTIDPAKVPSKLKSLIPTKEQLPEFLGSMAGSFRKEPGWGTAIAALGAATGEGVRQAVFEKKPLTPKERISKLGWAATRGAFGEGMGRAVGKAFTFGASAPEVAAANKLAVREGIEVPVSNLTDSKAVQMTERALEYSPFGGIITRQKQVALGKFKEFANRVGGKIGADTPPEVTGSLAKEQTLAFKDAYDKAKDELYSAVMPQLKNVPAETTEIVQTLKDIVERRSGVGEPSGLKIIKKWIKQIEGGEIKTFADLKKFRTNLGSIGKFTDPAVAGLNADISQAYAVTSGALDKTASTAGQEIANGLKQADEFYAMGKNTLKSKVYKALSSAPQDRMHKIAFVPKSPMQYDLVKEIVGPDTIKDISGQWYRDIIKKSTSDGVLSPRKLLTELDRYDGTIQKLATDFPEIGTSFQELKQVASLMSKGRDVATGSQTAPALLGMGHILPSIAYSLGQLFTGNVKNAAVGAGILGAQLGVSAVGAKGITSRLGRDLITEGLPRTGRAATRTTQIGTQLGLQRMSE